MLETSLWQYIRFVCVRVASGRLAVVYVHILWYCLLQLHVESISSRTASLGQLCTVLVDRSGAASRRLAFALRCISA